MSATEVIDLTWSDSDSSDSGDLHAALESLSVESLKPVVDKPIRGRDDPNSSGRQGMLLLYAALVCSPFKLDISALQVLKGRSLERTPRV